MTPCVRPMAMPPWRPAMAALGGALVLAGCGLVGDLEPARPIAGPAVQEYEQQRAEREREDAARRERAEQRRRDAEERRRLEIERQSTTTPPTGSGADPVPDPSAAPSPTPPPTPPTSQPASPPA